MTSASASIAAIEKKYVVELPSSYKKLVSEATLEATHSDDWEPVIGNCWFNGLRGMLDKNPRYAEMLHLPLLLQKEPLRCLKKGGESGRL